MGFSGPTPTKLATATVSAWQRKFLNDEERATASLQAFFGEARSELEEFIRTGPLTKADQTFYANLLQQVQLREGALIAGAKDWVDQTIPTAYVTGAQTHFPDFRFNAVNDDAVKALSKGTLDLITKTTIDMRLAIQQQIAQGLLQGLSGQDIRNRLLQSGLTNIPHWPSADYRAGVIARTETMRAYNDGAFDAIEATGARFVRWIASPDEAVCSICSPRNGHVYRLPGSEIGGALDPYGPAVRMLESRPPAHPRCRCTIRAEYRGPDGRLIEDQVPVEIAHPAPDPVPDVPPAAGDLVSAIGPNGDKLKRLRQSYIDDVLGGKISKAEWDRLAGPSFWRELGPLGDSQLLRIIGAGKNAAAREVAIDAFMVSRYGTRYVRGPGMTPSMTLRALRALEAYRRVVPRYFTNSPYLTVLGVGPSRARKMTNSGECFATGHVRFGGGVTTAPAPGHAREHGLDATIELGEETVALHEFAHSIHNRYGLHASLGYKPTEFADYHPAYGSPAFSSWHDDWRAIRAKTKGNGVAPTTVSLAKPIADAKAAVEFAEERLQQTIADEAARTGFKNPYAVITARNRLANAQKVLDRLLELDAKPPGELYPTNYAMKNEAEDFAETVTRYMVNPALLRKWSPLRYDFVRTHVMEGWEK